MSKRYNYNRNEVIEDIKSKKMLYQQIADKHNITYHIVARIAYLENIGVGLPVNRIWNPPQDLFNKDLFYIIGSLMTDGYILKKYGVPSGFSLGATDSEFYNTVYKCLNNIGLHNTTIREYDGNIVNRFGTKNFSVITCTNTMFGKWISNQTNDKYIIPQFILDCKLKDISIRFIDSIIDGDGCITKRGAVLLYNTKQWIFDVKKILDTIGIKYTNIRAIRKLKSGKDFYELNINRKDYVENGGHPEITRKRERMY